MMVAGTRPIGEALARRPLYPPGARLSGVGFLSRVLFSDGPFEVYLLDCGLRQDRIMIRLSGESYRRFVSAEELAAFLRLSGVGIVSVTSPGRGAARIVAGVTGQWLGGVDTGCASLSAHYALLAELAIAASRIRFGMAPLMCRSVLWRRHSVLAPVITPVLAFRQPADPAPVRTVAALFVSLLTGAQASEPHGFDEARFLRWSSGADITLARLLGRYFGGTVGSLGELVKEARLRADTILTSRPAPQD